MTLRYSYRIYPTPGQRIQLGQTFGCVRFVYNWGLDMRSKGWKDGIRIGYPETSGALTVLKKGTDRLWLNEVSSVPLQQSLRHLQTAFVNFFDKRAAYPSFKKKGGSQSAEYTRSAFSFDPATRIFKVAKIGAVKVKWSRKLPSDPSSVTISRNAAGQYFASFVIEVQDAPWEKTGAVVGIDFGVARLATLSTGERIANPKFGAKYAARLAFLQRRLAKKQKGSQGRRRAKIAVAKLHLKIQNCRKDVIEKLTTDLVRRFDTICIEDLNLRGMVKSHSLARSLHDAAIGMASGLLEQKGARYGRTVVKIDRWFPSSKMCSKCGHLLRDLPLQVRDWICPECGAKHDRDENAAVNILAVGQTVTASGGGVRAKRTSVRGAGPRRNSNLQRGLSPAGIPSL